MVKLLLQGCQILIQHFSVLTYSNDPKSVFYWGILYSPPQLQRNKKVLKVSMMIQIIRILSLQYGILKSIQFGSSVLSMVFNMVFQKHYILLQG